MQPLLRLLPLTAILASPCLAQVDLGDVHVRVRANSIPVRVSADTSDLDALAREAFGAHGRYILDDRAFAYDIRFSRAGANQERVDIRKGPGESPVASELVPGTSPRNALLRAADFAVAETNGLGLRGFFASKLVFVSDRTGRAEVYEGDLFFGDVRQITRDGADSIMPRWSPDGRKVIYSSYLRGNLDIYLIDLASDERSVFASYKGSNLAARFSPDGGRVAMVLTGTGTPEIWVSDAEGHGLSRRTRSDRVKSSPCWSPDGSRIVFAQEPGPQLYVMSAAGGFPQRITHGMSRYCAEPDWSRANPDKIAFTCWSGGGYQIAVLDQSTGDEKPVSKAPFDGIEPCWLADGRHLVYTARDRRTSCVCILDTETGDSVRVSPPGFGSAREANVLAP